jgi:hypothetical protein
MISRRGFLGGSVALLATPLAVEAQQAGKVYRVGILSTGSVSSNLHLFQVFQQELRELGLLLRADQVIE